MKENNKKIGIIDSGIGGITVLEELLKILPNESYLYIADQKYYPYSNLSNNLIKRRLLQICKYLEKKKVKLIIIACNTASIFVSYLKRYIKTPIITVINPTCKEIIKSTKNKKVGLLATKTTIESKFYQKILESENINTYGVACSEFVKLIENNSMNTIHTKDVIKNKLKILFDKNIDTLVYGCTHFGIMHEFIEPYFKNINYVSSSKPTALFTYNYLLVLGLLNNNHKYHKVIINTTDNKSNMKIQIHIFNIKNCKIRHINI